MRMFQNYDDPKKHLKTNIYDFGEGGKGEDFQYVFDITPCFPVDDGKTFDFRIRFPVDVSRIWTNQTKRLVKQMRDQLEFGAGVSPMRLQNVIVSSIVHKSKRKYTVHHQSQK